jgi:hypothetical protein
LSIHVPTQAVVDNDDEEDMDISDWGPKVRRIHKVIENCNL